MLVSALALLLNACSFGQVGGVETVESQNDLTGTDVDGDPPDDLALVDEPLRIALVKPASWLPSSIALADQAAVIVADLVYDGLTEADGDQLVPALATGWQSNEDVTAWEFAIDTDRVSPAVVVNNFDRLIMEDSLTAATLSHVERIEVANGASVRFVLRRPDAGLPWLLSGVPFSVPRSGDQPSGRYDVVERPDGLTFERGGVAEIEIDWAEGHEVAAAMVTDGLADATVLQSGAGRLGIANEVSTAMIDSTVMRFYVVNGLSPLSDDLRSAVAKAIDAGLLSDDVSGPRPIDGVVGAAMAGYRPGACGALCGPDVASATDVVARMAAAGESLQLTVGYVSEADRPEVEVVVGGLRDVGFDAVAARFESADLVSAIDDGSVDIYLGGWIAPAASIDAVVPTLLAHDGRLNLTRASSPRIDALLAEAASTLSDEDRWSLLNDAQTAAIEQGMIVPVGVGWSHFVGNEKIASVSVRADGSLVLD